jgi:hypothetical protein
MPNRVSVGNRTDYWLISSRHICGYKYPQNEGNSRIVRSSRCTEYWYSYFVPYPQTSSNTNGVYRGNTGVGCLFLINSSSVMAFGFQPGAFPAARPPDGTLSSQCPKCPKCPNFQYALYIFIFISIYKSKLGHFRHLGHWIRGSSG